MVWCRCAEIVREHGIVERVRVVVKRERERTVQVRRNGALERGKVEHICVVVERERGKVGRERGSSWIMAFRHVVHALLITVSVGEDVSFNLCEGAKGHSGYDDGGAII